MAPVPTVERPPVGLDAYWLGAWRAALKVLKTQGNWGPEAKPLLDEYIYALRAAQATRDGFKWLEALEQYAENADDLPEIAWTVLREIAGSLPTQWDRHTKRAASLADQLALTARGRKAAGIASDDEAANPEDPFSEIDELADRRERRAS